jgi:hypothetical protein
VPLNLVATPADLVDLAFAAGSDAVEVGKYHALARGRSLR